jgi:tetratricopeptide (TPR) repeat protein
MKELEFLNMGIDFENEGNVQTAIQMYQKSLQVNQKFGEAHLRLAGVYQKLGDKRSEAGCLQNFINLAYLTPKTLELVPLAKERFKELTQPAAE